MNGIALCCVLLFIGGSLASDDVIDFKPCVAAMTNGCSVPAGLPFPYKDIFLPACERHDVCYTCGKNYNWTRAHCDKTFQLNMMTLCKLKQDFKQNSVAYSSFWGKLQDAFKAAGAMAKWIAIESGILEHCMNGVDVYYRTVRSFGHRNYHGKYDRSACNMKCTDAFGNPMNLL